MKNFNFTLVLISFFFFSLFAEGSAQSKVKINHYVKVKAQSFPKNNWLLYELKDSTIVFLAYEQRRLFHKKTAEEMMELEIKRELGELDLSTQELSVNYIDRVTVRHRKGPIFRTIAGIFVGTIVGVITADAYCKPIVQQEDFDSWCYQGIPVFFGTASAVTGIFALLPMPKVNINFNRNQHKNGKRYLKDFKKRLNPYAILQN